ncbi:MAG TPA: SOS response-associated peptidase [Actinomycetes bacterium]|nr:SOS response-associated peptidase [Actinomycetes bacterium]
MCGRYASAKDPDALVEEFEVDESKVEEPLRPDYNVAPTKEVYAVLTRRNGDSDDEPTSGEAERQLRTLKWGLVPSWAKDPAIGSRMINARAETLAEKPAFRRPFTKRRCLLPADGYFEWYTPQGDNVERTAKGKPKKQPFFIHRADGRSLAMAGLYEWWRDESREPDDPKAWLLSATIVTTDATDAVGRIHDRMPVVIDSSDWEKWLDPTFANRDEIEAMMRPALSTPLQAFPVTTQVNSVRNNGPELIAPLPLDETVPGSVGDDGFWPPPDER